MNNARRAFPLLCCCLAVLVVGGGCNLNTHDHRVYDLTKAYQRGELSREDYMRFIHESEAWDKPH